MFIIRPALAVGDHALADLLRDEEGAARVGRHDEIIVGLGDVDGILPDRHAGVVHQDADRAEALFHGFDGADDAGAIGDVHVEGHGAAILRADQIHQLVKPVHASGAGRNLRSRASERPGEVVPKHARRPGDEYGLALQLGIFGHPLRLPEQGLRSIPMRGPGPSSRAQRSDPCRAAQHVGPL